MLSPKLSLYTGSPPPMRGKAFSKANGNADLGITPAYAGKVMNPKIRKEEQRITPAYAGKRLDRVFGWRGVRDHPRLCGEKFTGLTKYRVRKGITPAYAGKREMHIHSFRILWDHPRLCGEKAIKSASHSFIAGSPPPMRGKAASKPLTDTFSRITPAYAGKREAWINWYRFF